jgi:hypothetical protein
MQKPLVGAVEFYAWVCISIHSSPMLQVNCLILHDTGPTPLLAILKPTPLITTN